GPRRWAGGGRVTGRRRPAPRRATVPAHGGWDAVVQDVVDAWAGSQGGELLQELNRREEEVARAVVPLALQGDEDEAVERQCEALLRHRRAQHVEAQALDARTVVGPHRDARVQIEALEVRLARPARGDPGGVGLAA